ncbi:MAG: isoamylase early set domain-containing protein [Bacteroidota bacterium]
MIAKKFLKSKPVCKATFSLPTEAVQGAKKVTLVGDFNNWDTESGIKMKKSKDVFKTTVDLETGKEYEFRYLLDGETWENDWAADKYVATPFGVENSVVSTLN